MTWTFAAEIITRLQSGTEEQKAEAVIYMNFGDYIELKKMAHRSLIGEKTICGVEVRPTFKCPAGQYYIRRK